MKKTKNKGYSCDFCIRQFAHKEQLKTHSQKKHQGFHIEHKKNADIQRVHEGILNCEKCPKLFERRLNLRKHIENVHDIGNFELKENNDNLTTPYYREINNTNPKFDSSIRKEIDEAQKLKKYKIFL